MTTFYAIANGKNDSSSVIPLVSTLYHRAEQEAEDICKQAKLQFQYIRGYGNGAKQPETLSKGNVKREHNKPSRKRK